MINTVNALTFRKKFGQLIDQVVETGSPLVIERQNKPLVILYPFEKKKEELSKKEKEAQNQVLHMLEDWRNKWGQPKKGEMDSVQLIRKMRDERYGKRWLKERTHYWNDNK